MNLSPKDIDVVSLRGRLTDYRGLRKGLGKSLLRGNYALVIVDAHYRMLPSSTSENDNAAIAAIYNLIDSMAADTRAAWFIVHHPTKGDQSDKNVTDVGAGAGAQSRAADTHLAIRTHKKDPDTGERLFVMEGAVRSFPPLKELSLRWKYPVWEYDARPPELKTSNKADDKHAADRKKVLDALAGCKEPITANQLRERVRMDRKKCEALLTELVKEGLVESLEITVSCNRATGYRLKKGG